MVTKLVLRLFLHITPCYFSSPPCYWQVGKTVLCALQLPITLYPGTTLMHHFILCPPFISLKVCPQEGLQSINQSIFISCNNPSGFSKQKRPLGSHTNKLNHHITVTRCSSQYKIDASNPKGSPRCSVLLRTMSATVDGGASGALLP